MPVSELVVLEGVEADATVHRVDSFAADEPIVAGATADRVVAGMTLQPIMNDSPMSLGIASTNVVIVMVESPSSYRAAVARRLRNAVKRSASVGSSEKASNGPSPMMITALK